MLKFIEFKKPAHQADVIHFIGITNYLQGIYEIDGFKIINNTLIVTIRDNSN